MGGIITDVFYFRHMVKIGYIMNIPCQLLHVCQLLYIILKSTLEEGKCGCSLVVKLQPSKLLSWVRFPSPAPYIPTQGLVSKKNEALRFFATEIVFGMHV